MGYQIGRGWWKTINFRGCDIRKVLQEKWSKTDTADTATAKIKK